MKTIKVDFKKEYDNILNVKTSYALAFTFFDNILSMTIESNQEQLVFDTIKNIILDNIDNKGVLYNSNDAVTIPDKYNIVIRNNELLIQELKLTPIIE